MKIEVELLIAVVSVITAFVLGIKNYQKTNDKDIRKEAFESAKISVKLDEIGNDVKDIKYDISSVKSEVKDIDKRLTIAEQSITSTNKRIEDISKE